jgi:mono/diheme cytochrome c family protein
MPMANGLSRAAAIGLTIVWAGALGVLNAQQPAAQRTSKDTWRIPAGAENEKSPLTVTPGVLSAGQKLYMSKCQRCHGKTGKGNGPDAEPSHQKDMDLTVASRADKNPDGVVFYRIWNGRTDPKMPAFSRDLSKEQVWALVAYAQSLRGR